MLSVMLQNFVRFFSYPTISYEYYSPQGSHGYIGPPNSFLDPLKERLGKIVRVIFSFLVMTRRKKYSFTIEENEKNELEQVSDSFDVTAFLRTLYANAEQDFT